MYSVWWWIRHSGEQDFLLDIDVDGPKLFIFLNTILMNNFSISKKLSHNDAYISQKNPEQFKFHFSQIFARKPLKKIKRNVISKFTRLAVAKLIMKYQLPNRDDVVFVLILGFHQLSFLYYAQMNCSNNYLRYFSSNLYLSYFQQFVKKYQKGISMLVKINKKMIKQGARNFSVKIVEFLFRMQLT